MLDLLEAAGDKWTPCTAIGQHLARRGLVYPGRSLKRAILALGDMEMDESDPSGVRFRLSEVSDSEGDDKDGGSWATQC